jgi:hypothetical protein
MILARGGAESGTLANDSSSPALSLLLKLTAGLTADERSALARMLHPSDAG